MLIKVIDNLGDRHPLDHGGYIIYRVRDPKKEGPGASWIQAEFWDEPVEVDRDEPKKDLYEVYRWQIEPDVFEELSWVKDWDAIASSTGMKPSKLIRMARSKDILDRAGVYEDVGRYHGFENLDSYPERFTREQMEERWPEFK